MADEEEAEAAEPCRLFKLPGELRNQIYRLVLIQPERPSGDSKITVHPRGYDRPSLLSTCKRIRAEALKIYYYENSFRIQMRDFNSAPLLEWKKQCHAMSLRQRIKVIGSNTRTGGEAWWPNLALWLRRYHRKQVSISMHIPQNLLEDLQTMDRMAYQLATLFVTAKEFRDQPWARIEKHIVKLRPAFIAIDEGWRRD